MNTETALRARKKTDRKDFQKVLLIRRLLRKECCHAINSGNMMLFIEKKVGTIFYLSEREIANHYLHSSRTIHAAVRLKPNYRGPVCLIPKDALNL